LIDERRDEEAPLEAALANPEPQTAHWLEPVFREHSAVVLQTAYRVTGNAADAEDVLQTVFIRLARRTDPPDLSRGAVGYLRRAATNAALDIVQSRGARSSSPLSANHLSAADTSPTPERLHFSGQVKQRLREALARLSRRHAEMFTLRYFEGLDNPQIAEMYDTSPGTVAVTLHRVRAQLMEDLGFLLGGTK